MSGFNNNGMAVSWSDEELVEIVGSGGWRMYCVRGWAPGSGTATEDTAVAVVTTVVSAHRLTQRKRKYKLRHIHTVSVFSFTS